MKKLKAEIIVIIGACFASLVIRMIIGLASLPHNKLAGGAESFLYGLLMAVAGLTLDGILDLSSFQLVDGFVVCLYYGLIAYAAFVFLSIISVGISYEFYSRIQTVFMRFRKRCTYYIFTAVTKDALVLAEDIKRHELSKKKPSYAIVFFDNKEESFSRKNPLHRRLMQDGFYYYSDPRCTDKGETISFLKKFKFNCRNCVKDDVGENHNKLFYVFAMNDTGDYEMGNADVVFDDIIATLNAYIYKKKGKSHKMLPTVLNYYILTSSAVNYESYDRRTKDVISTHISKLSSGFYDEKTKEKEPSNSNEEKPSTPNEETTETVKAEKPKEKSEILFEYIDSKIKINVFNEATLSSNCLVLARNAHLNSLGSNAFSLDSAPDENGAYRVAVIGFGKTGEYAMEELYTHTAHLSKTENNGYVPTQFIADIYDGKMDEKSGQFAYNHPLFRCIDDANLKVLSENKSIITDTKSIIEKAKSINGKAIEILYSEYMEKSKKPEKDAKDFIDLKMAFPIAVMHKENAFSYPFLAEEGTEMAVDFAYKYGIRDFIIALGADERNIEVANMLIGSFRRHFSERAHKGKKFDLQHVTIYVNLIEEKNRSLINWDWINDAKQFTCLYEQNDNRKWINYPYLSVIPFGYRTEMYSYTTLVEDYKDRIYNYGYNLLGELGEAKKVEKEAKQNYDKKNDYESLVKFHKAEAERKAKENIYNNFKGRIDTDYNSYRDDEKVIDQWLTISQLLRLSNKSARNFSINYYIYKGLCNGRKLSENELKYMDRLEHERWNRFYISHGWVYANYSKSEGIGKMSKDEIKTWKRGTKQHNCLCPYDEMLGDDTKAYDRGNVELGFVEGIVFDKKPSPSEQQ